MSSSKRSTKAGSKGEPPPTEPQPETQDHAPPSSGGGRKFCSWHLLALLPIIIAFLVYHIPTIYEEWMARRGYGEVPQYEIPAAALNHFRLYDANADGKIDPYEFMAVIQDMNISLVEGIGANGSISRDVYQFVDGELAPGKEGVTLLAQMIPMSINSMSKFSNKNQFIFGSPQQLLPGLLKWTKPNHPIHTFGTGNFKIFLPPSGQGIGEPYYVIDSEYFGRRPHMNMYYPPPPRGNEVFIHAILSMFHANIFVNTRFGPRGTLAVLRAENDKYYDVIIRSHVEFQLNSEPNYPFWFTPGQFAGRLIISKDCTHVEFFEFVLPTKNALNIDMEWITGPDQNEVDIGFCSKMKLFSSSPSIVFNDTMQVSIEVPDDQPLYPFNKHHWTKEIPVDEAISILGKKLYPFTEIPYLPFLDAFALAKKEKKLVHSIVLWGALDDQSC